MPTANNSKSALLQKWLTLLLLFCIPLSLHYLTEHPFAISSLNLLSVAVILLGALNLLTKQLTWQPVRNKSFIWVIGGLLLAMLWALFFTHPLRNGVGLWTSRLSQPLLLAIMTYQLIANGYLQLEEIVTTLFLSLIPLAIVGALQVAHIIPYGQPHRITALYQFPNTFARYVFMLLLVSLPWLLMKAKYKLPGYVLWGVGVLLLLGSVSYGGSVSLFCGLVTILLLLPSEFSRLKKYGLIGLTVLALLVVTQAPRLPKWHTSITDSKATRLEFWHVALGVIHDHFWTGIGIKGWETQYSVNVLKYISYYPPLNWASPQPHDVFLDSFVKAGFPGFVAIMALLLWPVIAGIKLARKRDAESWYGIAIAACGVALIVFGIIDDPFWSDDMIPLLFILYSALAWALSAVSSKTPS